MTPYLGNCMILTRCFKGLKHNKEGQGFGWPGGILAPRGTTEERREKEHSPLHKQGKNLHPQIHQTALAQHQEVAQAQAQPPQARGNLVRCVFSRMLSWFSGSMFLFFCCSGFPFARFAFQLTSFSKTCTSRKKWFKLLSFACYPGGTFLLICQWSISGWNCWK